VITMPLGGLRRMADSGLLCSASVFSEMDISSDRENGEADPQPCASTLPHNEQHICQSYSLKFSVCV